MQEFLYIAQKNFLKFISFLGHFFFCCISRKLYKINSQINNIVINTNLKQITVTKIYSQIWYQSIQYTRQAL